MGYSVRSHTWRYTVWMPVTPNENDTSRPALITDWSATATSTPPPLRSSRLVRMTATPNTAMANVFVEAVGHDGLAWAG